MDPNTKPGITNSYILVYSLTFIWQKQDNFVCYHFDVLIINSMRKGPFYYPAKKIYNYLCLVIWWFFGSRSKKATPHLVKRSLINKVQKDSGAKIFIETGTYMGEMVFSVCNLFEKVFTIEIDPDLYENAKLRLRSKHNVQVLQGDSAKVLPKVLSNLDQDIIFWLDAHYSGGITGGKEGKTPIEKELLAIFDYKKTKIKKCYILIDDAGCFTGKDNYPTLLKIETLAKEHEMSANVKKEIIRLLP